MKSDRKTAYILEISLIIILFFALFASNIFTRWGTAIFLGIYSFICHRKLRKRDIRSYHKNQVKILMTVFGIIYVGVIYLIGLYFGFVLSKIQFSIPTLINVIIPFAIILISSEVIRETFLSQKLIISVKKREKNISPYLTFISMVLIDVIAYIGIYDLSILDDFLTALGYVLFASLSSNLLFNYIANRYDTKGILIYRLITNLYMYIIPVIPDTFMFLQSFIKMLYPYILYVLIDKLFSKNEFSISYGQKKKDFITTTCLMVVTLLMIILISGQFKYGVMVIGSRSMTGTLNKGDVALYERYEEQTIDAGQVIIFDYKGIQTIHRVVKIVNVNGENRYYTKGDANAKMDESYTTDSKIYGLVKVSVKYAGYPTIWVKEIFS